MRRSPWFIVTALLYAFACSSAGGVGPEDNPAGSSGKGGKGGKAGAPQGAGGSDEESNGGESSGGESAGGASAGSGAGAQGGATAAGGSAGAGAGGDPLDGGAFGGGSSTAGSVDLGGQGGQGVVDDACAAVAQKAGVKLQPADLIWFVDTSGSMLEETVFVQNKLNAFAQGIFSLGIDVHVVMVAQQPFCFGICLPGICIPAPLGSGNCPNDTKLPSYFHDIKPVESNDGLLVIKNTYPDWKAMLRPEATKTLIVITDDDALMEPYDKTTFPDGAKGAAKKFIDDFTALDPKLLAGWKMNGIYSFTKCPSAANVGETWAEIVDQTGGVKGDLCKQDFQPIFNDMAKAIQIGSKPLECQWNLPAPPAGQTLDTAKVNVKFTSGTGQESDLYYVDGQAACDPQKGGWYFDNAAAPTAIIACPASCKVLEADAKGQVDILFGCARKGLDIQ